MDKAEKRPGPVADDESLKQMMPKSPMNMGGGDDDLPALEFNDEEEFDKGLKSLAFDQGLSEDEMDEALVSEGALTSGNLDEYLKRGMSGMDIKKMIMPKKWELPERIKRIKGRKKREESDAE